MNESTTGEGDEIVDGWNGMKRGAVHCWNQQKAVANYAR
jgi:hypothetical protein